MLSSSAVRQIIVALILGVSANLQLVCAQTPVPEQPDNYRWLEDVWGDRSMAWVKAENAKTSAVLESDARFAELQDEALKIAESPDRLAIPRLQGGWVYNTWQDAQHVRGIIRRTTVSDYLQSKPDWHTLVDYDELSQQDNEKWVPRGINGLYPGDRYALVGFSAGGEDADSYREFDLKSGQFVKDGFQLPKSKQNIAWIDKDTLALARDWGPGTMTASGYPFIVKIWKRGTPLQDAKEVFRGDPTDVSAGPSVLNDGHGHQAVLFSRGVDFFNGKTFLWTPSGAKELALPGKHQISGLLDNRLIVELNEDWQPEGSGTTIPRGSVVALDLNQVKKDPTHLAPELIFSPTATEFEQQVSTTKNCLIMTTLDNVQGRAYVYRREGSQWRRTKIDVPDNIAVGIVTTSDSDDHFFLSETGFLTPTSLYSGNAANASLTLAKSLPPQFDAAPYTVEQLYATSKDGTRVPYFVVHRKDMKYDGSNPTLLSAYGGFQVSSTPGYSGTRGKLWLDRGGVFVLANIRGGGEFGPAWHEAGLKTNRQRIYDDFAAVGQDLCDRKITSPRRLGIQGGSNGGLLMGVEMTQHPEMWNAIIIDVPLLDMLRFEQIGAGASWVGEYGSVSIPEQRAFLASISPYNQLKPDVTYPEPLIFTTTKDDRVGPVHARKFAARMEEFHKPFFYDEITEGGHSSGADLKEQAKTAAINYIYLIRKLMD